MWLNMDADTEWKPRWGLPAAVTDAVETAEKIMAAAKEEEADHLVKEMICLRTALMRVLNSFPDAAKAVTAMFMEITRLGALPPWMREGG